MEGRIGNVIFYQRNGKQCIRIAPNKVKNPRTPAQQLQRAKMVAVSQWLQPLKDVLRLGYIEGTPGYHFNRAIKALHHDALVVDEGSEPHIDPSKALIAQGTLTPMTGGAAAQEGAALRISWSVGEKTARSHVDDKLVWVLYNENEGKVISNVKISPKPKRHTGECLIDLSTAKAGTYHLYAFFINNKMTQSSD